MITSAILTESQLAGLNAIVPSFFKVKVKDNIVVIEFYSPPETGRNALLSSFRILPAANPDYTGSKLAEVVEDLCGTVTTLYREYAEKPEMDAIERGMKLMIKTIKSVKQRKLSQNELEIINNSFDSIVDRDWFG